MARVNVEQTALTDSRFAALGEELGAAPEFAHAVGLGLMCHVWNECQERETKTLTSADLRRITKFENAGASIISADLGVPSKGGRIRIRGTKGRVEWLANARSKGRTGGRPRKPYGSKKENPTVLAKNNPPAPAPAPAPAENQKNLSPPSETRKKKAAGVKTKLDPDWRPSAEQRAHLVAKYRLSDSDFDSSFAAFQRNHIGKESKWVRWDMALENWIAGRFVDAQSRTKQQAVVPFTPIRKAE